jgi:Ion transport protein
MPDLLRLLRENPTLSEPFLAESTRLVQAGEISHYKSHFTLPWVRAAHSATALGSFNIEEETAEYMAAVNHFFGTDCLSKVLSAGIWLAIILFWCIIGPFYWCMLWLVNCLWGRSAPSSRFGSQQLRQRVVPVHSCNSIELLEAAVQLAELQGSALVFKSEVLAAVTDLHWNLYGKADHLFSLVVYMVLLAVFVLLIVQFDMWSTSTNKHLVRLAWSLQGIKCLATLYFVWQELSEFMYKGLQRWLFDVWNIMDATAYSLIYISVSLQVVDATNHSYDDTTKRHGTWSKVTNIINAIAAVLLWCKSLHYMRPYQSTGPLVSMIFKILMAIRPFMAVLTVVVLGFATAFYAVLSASDSSNPLNYSHPDTALRTSFSYMLGTYELAVLDAGPSQVMLSILWVVFSVIVSILLMNLLIAIISDNFSNLYTTVERSYRMEKCKVVILHNIKLSKTGRTILDEFLLLFPYIHVYTLHVHEADPVSDQWGADRINVITSVQAEVTELKEQLAELKHTTTEKFDELKQILLLASSHQSTTTSTPNADTAAVSSAEVVADAAAD